MHQHVSFNFILMTGYVKKCLRIILILWKNIIKSSWRIGEILLSSKNNVLQVPLQKGMSVNYERDLYTQNTTLYFTLWCWKYGIACMWTGRQIKEDSNFISDPKATTLNVVVGKALPR